MTKNGAPLTDSSSQWPATTGTGTSVGASADMIRASRPTSCAEASTECSGGRRSAHLVPPASATQNVRFERPPAIRSKRSGGRAAGTCRSNQAVTASASIPAGASSTAGIVLAQAAAGSNTVLCA